MLCVILAWMDLVWGEPLKGRLPPGDALLVADVHLDSMAVTVGVANPQPPATLIALTLFPQSLRIRTQPQARWLAFRQRTTTHSRQPCWMLVWHKSKCQIFNASVSQNSNAWQDVGTASSTWWETLGRSCEMPGLPDLRSLEASLAERCAEFAETNMLDSSIESEAVLGKLAGLKRLCAKRMSHATAERIPAIAGATSAKAPLDREDETREVRRFLDDRQQTVLFLSGLDDVGKSIVAEWAFSQSGKQIHAWIDVYSDTSLAFLLAALAKAFRIAAIGTDNNPFDAIADEELVSRIPLGAAVVVADIDNLRAHGQWRDTTTPQILNRLVAAFAKRQAKLILIASRRIEIDELEPRRTRRIYVRGLRKSLADSFLTVICVVLAGTDTLPRLCTA